MAATEVTSVIPKSKPKTEQMVKIAISSLNDRTGSSVQAIKKYIISNYSGIDEKKTYLSIKKYLKKAVDDGTLVQTKGKGATGSFKLSQKANKPKALKKKIKEKNTRAKPKPAQTQADGAENTKKNTVKKGTSQTSTEKVTKIPKLSAAGKTKVVAGPKKVVENSKKGVTAADVKNNNVAIKSAPKRKNIAVKLVRRSLIILNAAAQGKIKPTKNKVEISVPNSDESASTEDEVYRAAPAKVKTTSKKGAKGVK